MANYRFIDTSWRCIPSAAWLRTPSLPPDFGAERRTLPLAREIANEKDREQVRDRETENC